MKILRLLLASALLPLSLWGQQANVTIQKTQHAATPADTLTPSSSVIVVPTGGSISTSGTGKIIASSVQGVISVTEYGAKGDGMTDDTAAIQAAINASFAGAAKGTVPVVYLPSGSYKTTSALICTSGSAGSYLSANIQGDGMYQSLIYVTGSTSTDGLVWSSAAAYVIGGSLKDVGLYGTYTTSRDLLVVANMQEFHADRVLAAGAGRYCLNHSGCELCDFVRCHFSSAQFAGAYVGTPTTSGALGTSSRFLYCFFGLNQQQGVKSFYNQTDLTFTSCTFEENGYAGGGGSVAAGQGLYGLVGTFHLSGCYFENNTGHDSWFGDASQPNQPPYQCTVVNLNPTFHAGPHTTAGNANIFYDQVLSGSNVGGTYGTTSGSYTVMLSAAAIGKVTISGWPSYQAGPVDHTGTAISSQSPTPQNFFPNLFTTTLDSPDGQYLSILAGLNAGDAGIRLGWNGQATSIFYDDSHAWTIKGAFGQAAGELYFTSPSSQLISFSPNGGITIGSLTSNPPANGLNVKGSILAGGVAVPTHTPSSSTDTGTAGTITWDSSYIYVCISNNHWARASIATW